MESLTRIMGEIVLDGPLKIFYNGFSSHCDLCIQDRKAEVAVCPATCRAVQDGRSRLEDGGTTCGPATRHHVPAPSSCSRRTINESVIGRTVCLKLPANITCLCATELGTAETRAWSAVPQPAAACSVFVLALSRRHCFGD